MPSDRTAIRSAFDALYVHVPFCTRKCPYCAFACTDDYGGDDVTRFFEGVDVELRRRLGHDNRPPTSTLYFGGGTPSALGPAGVHRLRSLLDRALDLRKVREFTVEANPSHCDDAFAAALAEIGCDRASLGAQSFDPDQLRRLGRDHEAPDVARALRALRAVGIENATVDLMYGLPLQSVDAFAEDVRAALDLGVRHLSLYQLEFEPTTPFGFAKSAGRMSPADEGAAADMFHRARELCTAYGLYWYEASNFASPGSESVHNRVYWDNAPYAGIGPGAYGRIGRTRYRNDPDPRGWFERLRRGDDPAPETDELGPEEDAVETLVAGLRTRRGVRWPEPPGAPGGPRRSVVAAELVAEGLALVDEGRLRLTVRGMLVLDRLLPRFFDDARTRP